MRLIYTDIDGTLVGPGGNIFTATDGNVSTATIDALVAARQAGVDVVGVSGRDQMRMRELARVLGMAGAICELGAVLIDEFNTTYDFGDFPASEFAPGTEPADVLRPIVAALIERFASTLEEHTPWNDNREVSIMAHGRVSESEMRDWLDANGAKWVSVSQNGAIKFRETLPSVETPLIYHFAPGGVSKATGIAADRAHRGLSKADVIMIGDSPSDLACASEVGTLFIVANGAARHPEMRAVVEEQGSTNVAFCENSHGAGFAEAVMQSLL